MKRMGIRPWWIAGLALVVAGYLLFRLSSLLKDQTIFAYDPSNDSFYVGVGRPDTRILDVWDVLNPFSQLEAKPNGYLELRGTLTGVNASLTYYHNLQMTKPDEALDFYANPGYRIELERLLFLVGYALRGSEAVRVPAAGAQIGLDAKSPEMFNANVVATSSSDPATPITHALLIITGSAAQVLERHDYDHFHEMSYYLGK